MGLPVSLGAYYQGIGRAGRDGKAAEAHLLFSNSDYAKWQWVKTKGTKAGMETSDWKHSSMELQKLLSFCHGDVHEVWIEH